MKNIFGTLTHKIGFWLILFFVVRLIAITNPPLETAHSWRQATGLMAARNFYETDNNILYPRVDFAGNKTGITGMEFPLMNYLIYLVALLFGYQHWYGRLINLLFSTIGCYYFYLIIRDYIDKKTAFWSAVILPCTLWFAYSRKTMPDIFSISLIMAAIYHGLYYLKREHHNYINLSVYALLAMAGMLSKIPSGFLLVVMILPVLDKTVPIIRKILLAGISLLILVPVFYWYLIWVPYLDKTFGFTHYFMGMPIGQGFEALLHYLGDTLKRFYTTAMGFSGFALFLAGIILIIRNKDYLLRWIMILCGLSFLFTMLNMGRAFALHTYYVLIFIPVMALAAGYAIANIKKRKWQIILVVLMALENITATWTDFKPRTEKMELVHLESYMDTYTKRTDLVTINCAPDPVAMYMAHRKGWITYNAHLKDPKYIEMIKNKGCRYILILKRAYGSNIDLNLPLVNENENFKIYRL